MPNPVCSLWRSVVAPGGWTYLWSNQPVIEPMVSLTGRATGKKLKLTQVSRRASPAHFYYQGRLDIPAEFTPGTYLISSGSVEVGELTVTTNTERIRDTGARCLVGNVIDLWNAVGHKATIAPNTLFVRCRFLGIASPPWEWSVKVVGDGCGFIDCTFVDALKGVVIETNWNRVRGCLVQGCSFSGFEHGHNNLEGVMTEGKLGMDSLTVLGTVYRGLGTAVQVSGQVDGVAIRGLWTDGNGIRFHGDARQTVEELRDIEIHGGGIWGWDSPNVTGPGIDRMWDADRHVNVIGPVRSRWNQPEGPAGEAWMRAMPRPRET